jgi:uncharacterized membrane protein YjgN (DUF898 family)
MTVTDAVEPADVPAASDALPPPDGETAAPAVATGKFHGSDRAFFGLLLRGAFFLLLTLGIYRFWLATDVRRFLWGNTEIAHDSLEYTGTAWELLIGFLMAIVLLLPINGVLFLATFVPWLLPFSGALAFVLLAWLGQFAVYRARRYRLTRTVFRGVRMYQTGSAWRYAIRSILWWVMTLVTLGLAYPWAQANLERYKMRHTHYGNLSGSFAGSGTRLFFRGFLLWLVVIGPFVAGVVVAIATIDWMALATMLVASSTIPSWDTIENASPGLPAAVVFAVSGISWAGLAAALLYPAFRAIVLRWWVSGLHLGGVSSKSLLRTGQVYRVYLRFLGYSLLFAILAGIILAGAGGVFALLADSVGKSTTSEILATFAFVGAYVIIALGYSTVYQATVTIRLWRLSFETTEMRGLEALNSVEARGSPSSAFGEGLADALDVGGL